jgi:hypothetical protein
MVKSAAFTEIDAAATLRNAPVEIRIPIITAGTKIWGNCWCASNTGTLDFFYRIT